MPELQTIQQIFNNKIFRIPDYQRGFSWNEKQLEAFWQDLENLQENKLHFTGAITVERATENQYKKWEDDQWIIESKDFAPYYIVDGQQRLTTIIILIYCIANKLTDDDHLLFSSKLDIFKKYIYQQNEKFNLKSYLFGYDVDNPSFEFLKTQIFEQESFNSSKNFETTYSNNLSFAKSFFEVKLSNYDSTGKLEPLYKKVTQRLKFDFQEIDKELDIFVVFETMNNRGKPLTNLELLKNRLIYLTTLLSNDNIEKDKLRRNINETWKVIYEYLGKDKNKELADDEFLRVHWIMYKRFDKEAEFYKKDIFDNVFTVNELVKGFVSFDEINKYILSLQKSVKQWYKIKNPIHAFEKEVFSVLDIETVKWLEKLNRLTFTIFEPLTLAVFCKQHTDTSVVNFLKSIEDFIFCVFYISRKSRNTQQKYAYYTANKLFLGEIKIDTVINDLENDCKHHFKFSKFKEYIEDSPESFYSWNGLKYLLYEYEEYLQNRNEKKVIDWNADKNKSIEHIYPQNPVDTIDSYWNRQFISYSDDEKSALCNSLGNLLLLSKTKNSELQNFSFDAKKQSPNKRGEMNGYYRGSYSEIEVSLYKEWNAQVILERGIKIWKFLEYRWNIKQINKSEVKNILKLSFVKDTNK